MLLLKVKYFNNKKTALDNKKQKKKKNNFIEFKQSKTNKLKLIYVQRLFKSDRESIRIE